MIDVNPYPGSFFADEDIETYHENKAVSHSKLKTFIEEGPLYFYHKYITKEIVQKSSKAMAMGQLVHLMLEGTQAFRKYVAIWEGTTVKSGKNKGQHTYDKRGKDYQEFLESHEGKMIISPDEYEVIQDIVFNVKDQKLIMGLMEGDVFNEPTIRIKLEDFNFKCQCRPDILSLVGCPQTYNSPYILEFKSTESLSGKHALSAYLGKFGAFRQAAFNAAIINSCCGDGTITRDNYYLVFIERAKPHQVVARKVAEDAWRCGYTQSLAYLKWLNKCFESNTWPGLTKAIEDVDLFPQEKERIFYDAQNIS